MAGKSSGALLDTDFLIDLNRGRHNPWRRRAEKLLLEMDEELYISTVTVVEFLTGIPEDKQEEARRMLQELYLYLLIAVRYPAGNGTAWRVEPVCRSGSAGSFLPASRNPAAYGEFTNAMHGFPGLPDRSNRLERNEFR